MTMKETKVSQIARKVATANLEHKSVLGAHSVSTTDSLGRDALRITIVVTQGSTERIEGNAALRTLVEIRDKLQNAGDDRFPIIEYATQKELSESGDS
jgi:hypothetical protein